MKVGAGANHSLALARSGAAYAWGSSRFGQCGTGAFGSMAAPARVAAQGRVTDLEAGWWHSLFAVEG